mgnify:CR=1 FL=1
MSPGVLADTGYDQIMEMAGGKMLLEARKLDKSFNGVYALRVWISL